MPESKRERFIRIAENRTNRIIDTLRLLANCSNKSNYDYTEEDIKKIFTAIEKEVRNTRSAFSGGESDSERFTLR